MKRLFSALLATVFAFSSFTLSASALESKHIKNADTSAVVEYQYVPSHFNKDAVGSIDDVIFENVADASTIAAPFSVIFPRAIPEQTGSPSLQKHWTLLCPNLPASRSPLCRSQNQSNRQS